MARTHLADRTLTPSPLNMPMAIIDAAAGLVEPAKGTPRRTKVAIVAAGSGRDEAPYLDAEWEVWALNAVPPTDAFGRLRADRWFEMHEEKAQSEADLRWIRACPMPIYLPPKWADQVLDRRRRSELVAGDIPRAVRYPLEAIEETYGSYFVCTFAYQIALALLEGFTDIGLYGVELALGTARERTLELACVSWWLGRAEGSNVTIHLPQKSMLGRHKYRYGIEYDEEKRYVEQYVDLIRKSDRHYGVDEAKPYDSGAEENLMQGQADKVG